VNVIYFFVSILFLIWITRNVLFWVALWQIKEYRLDRILIHLRETRQGKNLLFSYFSLLKFAAILGYGLTIFYDFPRFLYAIIVVSIFTTEAFFVRREYFSHMIRRPTFTLKALIVVLTTVGIIFSLLWIPLTDKFLWLLFLDRFVTVIVAILVFAFAYPTEFYRDIVIEKAVKKIRARKNLLVVGITGSYGKSSTKDYVAQILEKKFSVLKTKGTNNTPIGIANTIHGGLRKDTEIFVAEMGAYKIGEIKQMSEMVHPKIGILTAVSNQHLSLFGSLGKTMQAKYELTEALPRNGLALFNGNNENAYLLYQKTKKPRVLYLCMKKATKKIAQKIITDKKAHIVAFNIIPYKEYIAFDVAIKKKVLHMKTSLIGEHTVENILPGIYLANYLGMNDKEIKHAVAHITPLPKTMIRHESKGITYIDDTFNASPDAVIAAAKYMKVYKGKRFLVLQPMIELGKNGAKEHFLLGQELAQICEYILLTNKNFYKEVQRGVQTVNPKCKVFVKQINQIVGFIATTARSGDVVVFEGKEAAFVFNKIL